MMTLFFGLTGSIGMGKSTTAEMFRKHRVPVYDADATVHELYRGEAVPLVEQQFPGSTVNGKVDRALLSKHVIGNEKAMKLLEAIVHPLVRQAEIEFRKQMNSQNESLAVLDNPLLFEMGQEVHVDGIIVVTAPADVQRKRVMARPQMTEEKFKAILKRQVPDSIKRQKADFIIDTSKGMASAEQDVVTIIKTVRDGNWQRQV